MRRPGEFPYRRGARATGDWQIREEIDAADPKKANREACAAVGGGRRGNRVQRVWLRVQRELNALLANLDEIPDSF